MSITQEEFERLSAIVAYATLRRSIEMSWPHQSEEDRRIMLIAIIGRIASLEGFMLRRMFVTADDDDA